MASISWGAPTLEFFKLTAGQVLADSDVNAKSWATKTGYVKIEGSRILEGSTTLETSQGETKTLKNAHGIDVDSKILPSSYNFQTSVIRQKTDRTDTIASKNGIVEGEWAMRLIPEDSETLGFCFRKCSISVQKGWSEEQGILEIISVNGVQPNGTDTEICKIFTLATA